MTYWLAWEEPRAVGDLVHVEKFFARNLGGLIHARTRVPGRLGKATSRTSSMNVDEKSDEVVVLRKRSNKRRQLLAEVVDSHPGVTKTALVEQGLRALLAREAAARLADLGGTAPRARRAKRSAWKHR